MTPPTTEGSDSPSLNALCRAYKQSRAEITAKVSTELLKQLHCFRSDSQPICDIDQPINQMGVYIITHMVIINTNQSRIGLAVLFFEGVVQVHCRRIYTVLYVLCTIK